MTAPRLFNLRYPKGHSVLSRANQSRIKNILARKLMDHPTRGQQESAAWGASPIDAYSENKLSGQGRSERLTPTRRLTLG